MTYQTDGPNEASSTIVITRASASMDGWYQCTAFNEVGSDTTRGRLKVLRVEKEELRKPVQKLSLPKPARLIEPE